MKYKCEHGTITAFILGIAHQIREIAYYEQMQNGNLDLRCKLELVAESLEHFLEELE